MGSPFIELLIVIVILGILAAIVVFAVQNLTGSSAQASCKADYKTVETAVEAYNAQVGHYPTAADATTAAYTGAGHFTEPTTPVDAIDALMAKNGSSGPWLRDFPVNGSHYQIVVSPNGTNPSYIAVFDTGATPASSGPGDPATLATASSADCGSVK